MGITKQRAPTKMNNNLLILGFSLSEGYTWTREDGVKLTQESNHEWVLEANYPPFTLPNGAVVEGGECVRFLDSENLLQALEDLRKEWEDYKKNLLMAL